MWVYTTSIIIFFFFNDTATTEIYTLSLHDALPILPLNRVQKFCLRPGSATVSTHGDLSHLGLARPCSSEDRSEEHTSELQSQSNLVCRLLLEKKKTNTHGARRIIHTYTIRHAPSPT